MLVRHANALAYMSELTLKPYSCVELCVSWKIHGNVNLIFVVVERKKSFHSLTF